MKHHLPPLPFEPDALEPALSAETLRFHHGRHHAGYVDKLNALLPGSGLEDADLATLLRHAQDSLYDNAAQHFNHSMYWACIQPGGAAQPPADLERAIEQSFGSVERLRTQFLERAAGLFGSGWCWLVREDDGHLAVQATSNAAVPVADCTPILTCDVWEHAYYLDYRNERKRYLEAFWKLVNWDEVAQSWRDPELGSLAHRFEAGAVR